MENTINPALIKIKEMVENAGSQVEVAGALEISPSYLSDILQERRSISANLAKRLGFLLAIVYIPIEKPVSTIKAKA